MNREPGFSTNFAAGNAGPLVWIVVGTIVVVLINSAVLGWMQ